jgi:hypothetical protein
MGLNNKETKQQSFYPRTMPNTRKGIRARVLTLIARIDANGNDLTEGNGVNGGQALQIRMPVFWDTFISPLFPKFVESKTDPTKA